MHFWGNREDGASGALMDSQSSQSSSSGLMRNSVSKRLGRGAGEMCQQLGALVAPAEGQVLFPASTWWSITICSSSRGSSTPLLASVGTVHACGTHVHTDKTQNTHTHKIKILLNGRAIEEETQCWPLNSTVSCTVNAPAHVCTNCIRLHIPHKTLILYSSNGSTCYPTLWGFSLLFAFSEEDRMSNSHEQATHNLKR